MISKKKYLAEQEVLRLLDSARNKDINKIKLSPANTWKHEHKKCEICYKLLQEGKRFLTEAIFSNGLGRADVINITDGIAIEVVCSESEESIIRKKAKYPIDFEVIRV